MRRGVSAVLPRLQGCAAGQAHLQHPLQPDSWRAAFTDIDGTLCIQNGVSGTPQCSDGSAAAGAKLGTPVSAWDSLRLKSEVPEPASPTVPWWKAAPLPGGRGYGNRRQDASAGSRTARACFHVHSAAAVRRHRHAPAVQAGAGASQQHAQTGGGLCVGGRPVTGKRTVAVGISGGVDSAVAAWLLKQQGHEVVGVFMRTWDAAEEGGDAACSAEADRAAARRVCETLKIPLHEAEFVRDYWNHVFTDFVAQCAQGVTPNPDLACNRHIKFGALLHFCKDLGADCVATGHYARIAACPDGGAPLLLRGVDPDKDQSYFLASVRGTALADVAFPVGHLAKTEVRRLAHAAGLPSAARRSSAGICFIGRRDYGDFVGEYMEAVPGIFVDVDTGQSVGGCPNLLTVTHGQGAGISGLPDKVYVAGKDMQERVAYVARGEHHPALYSNATSLKKAHWVAGVPPHGLLQTSALLCRYQARYRQEARGGVVFLGGKVDPSQKNSPYVPSAYCRLGSDDSAAPALHAIFQKPARAVTPQQAFVMYDGEVCLGSAPVLKPGRTLKELGMSLDEFVMDTWGDSCDK